MNLDLLPMTLLAHGIPRNGTDIKKVKEQIRIVLIGHIKEDLSLSIQEIREAPYQMIGIGRKEEVENTMVGTGDMHNTTMKQKMGNHEKNDSSF